MFNLIIKSFSLVEPKEIRKFYYLSILTIIAFILETASIGSIIPMLVFLTENQSNFIFFENFKYTEDFSDKEQLNFFVMVFVLLFLIKNIYLIFFDWYQNRSICYFFFCIKIFDFFNQLITIMFFECMIDNTISIFE